MKSLLSALLISGTMLATPALAQEAQFQRDAPDGRAADKAGDIIVTGTAIGSDILSTPADVSVLSGEEKERLQATSLGATLDHFAGVDTVGTGDQVGKPVIRGLSGNRIRILSDDLALDFQQFGVRHPPNIDPYLADRIEIVRGASSILYGSDAIGGAINVISKRPPSTARGQTEVHAKATGVYQSAYRQATGVASASGAAGPWGIAGTLIHRDSNGLVTPDTPTALETGDVDGPLITGRIPFTDFEQTNGDVALGYDTGIGQVVLRYEGYRDDHNFVVPDPPETDGESLQAGGIGQRLSNDIVHLFADLDVGGGLTLKPSLAYTRNHRVSNAGPPEPQPRDLLPEAAVLDITRTSYDARLEVQHDEILGGLSGRGGLEYEHIDQYSRGPTALTPGGRIDKLSAFALEEATVGKLILNVGGRFDYIRSEADRDRTTDISGLPDDDDQLVNEYTVFTGSLGAVYRLTDHLSLTANLGRGFRAPTLFEFYVNGQHGGVAAIQRGDPTLDRESSISVDGSIRYRRGDMTVKLTGYSNSIHGYIFPAGTGENAANGLPIFRISQEDAELHGADLEVETRPRDWLTLRGKAQVVDGELDDGTTVPLLPPFKLNGAIELDQDRIGPFEKGYATLSFDYAGAQDSAGVIEPFNQFDGAPPPFGTASTDDYFLTDIGVGASIDRFDLSLSVNNVFDVAYRDFLDTYKNITLGAGRGVVARLSVSI